MGAFIVPVGQPGGWPVARRKLRVEMHFATVWESVADALPERIAVIHGDQRRSWRDYEDRAARLASAFTSLGLRAGATIGLCLYNCPEYLECQFAALKMGAATFNVSYRYLDDELAYLLRDAGAEAFVFHTSLAERVEPLRESLPHVRFIGVDDGGQFADQTLRLEDLVASCEPQPRVHRGEDAPYLLYTGGTTGRPKGVRYRVGDLSRSFATAGFALYGLSVPSSPGDIPRIVSEGDQVGTLPIVLPACPLMHGAGMWIGAVAPHQAGGTVVTVGSRSFDGHDVLRAVDREGVTQVVLVGDAMSRPLIAAYDEASATATPYALSSLQRIVSSGAMWSRAAKEEFLDRVPQLVLIDALGSSETNIGIAVATKSQPPASAKFSLNPGTILFDENDDIVPAGSGRAGIAASAVNVPLGYHNDEIKSLSTFRTVNGTRYAFSGDWIRAEEDGTFTLLGRGSHCINTGGEKVYPEEVEEVIKSVEGVDDCLVVGVPHEALGQTVAALVQARPGATVTGAAITEHVGRRLASYKKPRIIVFSELLPRSPTGKPDYQRAVEIASEENHRQPDLSRT
jgi:3-oxocholest-4-en-26-oate---CoA ligase